ncbi:hypothetical protein HRI_002358900 [Hibiscus trionum]|uniref:RING-type E3 ubiquitin transferase n=1 Tax=Hibiscus trionum TaxID=183268 RepID=A0A9W7I0V8_HIBTR|nr:hypothetical protein HRI_002358900 [Hibiscus trionum]
MIIRCLFDLQIKLLVWLVQTVMLHNNMFMGGRLHSRDRFSNWRLDIDNMSYKELLELGDKIGYVNTGFERR